MVAERIKRSYGIDAEILHPPPGLTAGPVQAVAGIEPGFLLSVGRDRGYKNVEVVAAAMAYLPDDRLVTVGAAGNSGDGVRAAACAGSTGNVRHLGRVSDEELRWLYASARAVVSAAYEDFGLSPLEGFCFGTPAVVLRAGGFLDTMAEGLTGVFFEVAEPLAVAEAVQQLADRPDAAGIKAHAAKFSDEAFIRRLKAVINETAAPGPSVGARRAQHGADGAQHDDQVR